MKKLQSELESHRHNFDYTALADAPYLNAVIVSLQMHAVMPAERVVRTSRSDYGL